MGEESCGRQCTLWERQVAEGPRPRNGGAGVKANIRVQRPPTAGKESPGRRGGHGTGNAGWEGKGDGERRRDRAGSGQRPEEAGRSFWPENEVFRRKLVRQEGDTDAARAEGLQGEDSRTSPLEGVGESRSAPSGGGGAGRRPEPAGKGSGEAGAHLLGSLRRAPMGVSSRR